MRAAFLASALMVAACFQPSPSPCAQGCPAGASCVAGVCQPAGSDAAVPDATVPPVDTDGDGVVDALDLCPQVADPEQHDEDQDQIGNACDRCPHRAAGAQGDRDEDDDGVGDACDPGPEPHQWVYFTGFDADDQLWSYSGGSWSIEGGVLAQREADTTEASARLGAAMFSASDASLEVGGRVLGLGGVGRYLWLSVGEQMVGPATRTYRTCVHSQEGVAGAVSIEEYDGSSFLTLTSTPAPVPTPGGFSLAALPETGAGGGVLRCRFALPGGATEQLSVAAATPVDTPRGVYVEDLAIALEWAAVIARR